MFRRCSLLLLLLLALFLLLVFTDHDKTGVGSTLREVLGQVGFFPREKVALERDNNLEEVRKLGETKYGKHGVLSRSKKKIIHHLDQDAKKKTNSQHQGSYLKTIENFFKRLKGVNEKRNEWQDTRKEEGRSETEEGSEGERKEEEREEERREEGSGRRVQDWFGGRLKTLQEACTKFHNTSNIKVQ